MNKGFWSGALGLLLCCAVLISGAVFLPPLLAAAGDRALTEDIYLLEAEAPLDVSPGQLDTAGKLTLLEKTDNIDYISINMGRNMNATSSREAAAAEAAKLAKLGILPQEEIKWDMRAEGVAIYFVLQRDAPANNMILWAHYFEMGDRSGIFYVDDESGQILQALIVSMDNVTTVPGNALGNWLKAWGDYLELPYAGAEPLEEPGFYLASFGEGERRVSMVVGEISNVLCFGNNLQSPFFRKSFTLSKPS